VGLPCEACFIRFGVNTAELSLAKIGNICQNMMQNGKF
jgi:hypothetical protein